MAQPFDFPTCLGPRTVGDSSRVTANVGALTERNVNPSRHLDAIRPNLPNLPFNPTTEEAWQANNPQFSKQVRPMDRGLPSTIGNPDETGSKVLLNGAPSHPGRDGTPNEEERPEGRPHPTKVPAENAASAWETSRALAGPLHAPPPRSGPPWHSPYPRAGPPAECPSLPRAPRVQPPRALPTA
jgi:hypothetical protein